MAPAQMALPIERRNGASPQPGPSRPTVPAVEAPPVVAVAPTVEAVPELAPAAVPVWVQRVTTAAVLAVALVAAVASYESPYVKWCVG